MADKLKLAKKNIEKMWPDIKKQLNKLSKDALDLARAGEDKVITISKKSKLQFELLTLQLKREQLHYKLGKETLALLGKGIIKNKKLQSIYTQVVDIKKHINSAKRSLKK